MMPRRSTCVLALLVLGVAAWTMLARDTFAAVVGFVAYGLLLALVWVRLAAVDVALTEAAIGSGVTGVLLLGAAARLRARDARRAPGSARASSCAPPPRLLCAAIAAALAAVVLTLPDPAPTLAPRMRRRTAARPASAIPVTAVLIAYRALDTLLEKVVLVLALVGVWSLAPDALWGGRPGPRPPARRRRRAGLPRPPAAADRDRRRRATCSGSAPTIPGGAFQRRTILAAMWLLAMMAGLADAPAVRSRWLRVALRRRPGGVPRRRPRGLRDRRTASSPIRAGFAKPLILVDRGAADALDRARRSRCWSPARPSASPRR